MTYAFTGAKGPVLRMRERADAERRHRLSSIQTRQTLLVGKASGPPLALRAVSVPLPPTSTTDVEVALPLTLAAF